MEEYPKIQTVFKRDMEKNPKLVVEGEWTLPEFDYLAENEWDWDEKIDGTNIRVGFDYDSIDIRGRTDNATLHPKLVEAIRTLLPFDKLEAVFTFDDAYTDSEAPFVTLYGEGYGPKIQKGGKYRDDMSLILFDIKIGHWWLRRKDVADIAAKLDMDSVPYIGSGNLHSAIAAIKDGVRSRFGDFLAEGIVLRPKVGLADRGGRRIITKLKHRDFGIEVD
jgi:hypothetical protein